DDDTTAQLSGQATVSGDITVSANEVKNGVVGTTFWIVPLNYGGVSAVAGVGTDDTGSPLSNEQSILSSLLFDRLKKLVGYHSKPTTPSTPTFQASAATAVDDEVNTATALIGPAAVVSARGNL